jgi:argininosuccinate synthase
MNKVLLAFSGGLDTSYCARYLSVDLGMEVHSVIVDTGGFTKTDLERIAARAHACGVATHAALDRTQQLFDTVLRYCIAGNVLKNGTYPLSVSAERVVQAIAIAEHARSIGATHIAHGSTGAGNDQIRFDVIFRIVCPELPIITPIRDNKLSREDEINYLVQHGVEGDWTKSAYSINQGMWGTTIGGRETLTSHEPLPEHAWPSSAFPSRDAQQPQVLTISFDKGLPVALDGVSMLPLDVVKKLNDIGSQWHIGRDMHVGDTILGIKGRVAFEAPAAMITIKAHHALEKHTLTKWQLMLKDQLALWYGQLLHEGQFLEPAMRDIEAFFASTQQAVSGDVTVQCREGSFSVLGVSSVNDLMRSSFATYGEENTAWEGSDARGFAAISSIPSRLWKSTHGGAQ